MKTILLGLSDPYTDDPSHALCTNEPNSAGWRLWKMIHDVSGVTAEAYESGFERLNLMNSDKTRTIVTLSRFQGRRVVVLGMGALNGLGLVKIGWFRWASRVFSSPGKKAIIYSIMPHPSGRCLLYNDPQFRQQAGELLARELELGQQLP